MAADADPVPVVAADAVELVVVAFNLLSLPIPHGLAAPLGCVEYWAAVVAPVADAIVNRPVHWGSLSSTVNSA